MGCLCCGCCFSRKKHKSFPIHEKKEKPEVKKVFVQHIETVRQTPLPPNNKKTLSKKTMKKKPDELIMNRETTKDKKSSDPRQTATKIFSKSKQMKTPSPLPLTTNDISDTTYKKKSINPPSSSSSSTDSDSLKKKNNSKHRSFVESYNVSKDYSIQKNNDLPSRKTSNRNKSPAKSKLVLENVRKMIKDQNIQQQHFNNNRQKESVRL